MAKPYDQTTDCIITDLQYLPFYVLFTDFELHLKLVSP